MKATELIRDPGFQINVLLWMTLEQPREAYCIRPLFHEWRFTLFQVQRSIPLPVATVQGINESGLEVHKNPEPEMILIRKTDAKGIVFEAKAKSFLYQSPTTGMQTTNNSQARGLLLAVGPAFREVFGADGVLVYTVPESDRAAMSNTLTTLRGELLNKTLTPGIFSIAGLAVLAQRLAFNVDDTLANFTGFEAGAVPLSVELTDDVDPSPLYLLDDPSNYPDPQNQDRCRQIFIRKVQGRILSTVHHRTHGTAIIFDSESLLADVSENISSFMGAARKRVLLQLVRDRVFKYIVERTAARVDLQGCARYADGMLTMTFSTAEMRQAFLDWFEDIRQTRFDTSILRPTKETQPTLAFSDEQAEAPASTTVAAETESNTPGPGTAHRQDVSTSGATNATTEPQPDPPATPNNSQQDRGEE